MRNVPLILGQKKRRERPPQALTPQVQNSKSAIGLTILGFYESNISVTGLICFQSSRGASPQSTSIW